MSTIKLFVNSLKESLFYIILFIIVLLVGSGFVLAITNGYSFYDISQQAQAIINSQQLYNFTVIFISVLVEAAPFIMIGAFVSAIIQVFISEELIARVIPKNKMIGLLFASLMGFLLPVCECAIVPVMRRLLKKGVPLYISVTFMLAVPIVNPVVLTSTYFAFSGDMKIVILRGVFGMFGAMFIGSIVDMIQNKDELFRENECNKGTCCEIEEDDNENTPFYLKVIQVFDYASMELYEIGRFLILGALLSTLVQIYLPKSYLYAIGEGKITSIIALMLMTFLLSLCSEIDAFIGRTFMSQFTYGSIIGFLIYGPMIDLKNVVMLSGFFSTKFIIKLVTIITVVCFSIALIINFIV